MDKISKYPLLSAEEEISLAKKIATGDKIAQKKFINSNLRLVVSIANKFSLAKNSVMDVIQEGNLGLIIAVERFDTRHKVRFSTYAYPWIMQYMLRYLRKKNNLIHIPTRLQKNIRVSELSIDMPLATSNNLTLADTIKEERPTPEENALRSAFKSEIKKMICELPRFEQNIINYSFGFCSAKRSLREIALAEHCSPETVRKAKFRAIHRMKHSISLSSERSAVLTV
ncbi:MAG: sigma-70 family RNA polymerase sigma factor [Treponema sp.]|nr:sigma-70 family RNA polymerase sigma factor [Treponema sp.]